MSKDPLVDIDGILLLDKPLGISSNLALQKTKRLFRAKKAGHTGSLDPLATGMLPICFGQSTKFSRFLFDADKCYQVKIQFGQTTTTGDCEGEVINTRAVPPLSADLVASLLAKFTGGQSQVPPMFSALKHKGQPLYKLARAGKTIAREARSITIYSLDCEQIEDSQHCITLKVVCSKGTYIRTLAEDMGEHLGSGAHVVMLHRLWVFPFEKYSMVSIAQLEALEEEPRQAFLLPLQMALSVLPSVQLNAFSTQSLQRGQLITLDTSVPLGWVSCIGEDGEFLGIGEKLISGQIAPRRLMKAELI
jgi:tRNA pseudouridine55 synthase